MLVLDPEAHDEVASLARRAAEHSRDRRLRAPAIVARLLERWIELAERQLKRKGWSRTSFPQTQTEPWAWLADFLDESQHPRKIPKDLPVPPSCHLEATTNDTGNRG